MIMKKRIPYNILFIGLILLLALLAGDPPKTLFPVLFLYILSGPVMALRARMRGKKAKPVKQDNPPL